MKLELERVQCDPDVTIGSLSIDGVWHCWTLEDPVREVPGMDVSTWKVPRETAIPRGTYSVIVTPSQRFGIDLPLLVDVPGFAGVRIHPGNTAADTEGCILPGAERLRKSVGRSRVAFEELFAMISGAIRRSQSVSIVIS